MHDRAYALFSLAFLVILGAGIAVVAVWLTESGVQRQPYRLITDESIAGLDESSRLFFRGVDAGRVEDVSIEDSGRVSIRIAVDPQIPVTQGTYASLARRGLTGSASLALDDDGSDPTPLATDPDDPAVIPLRPGLLDRLGNSGEALVDDLHDAVQRLNRLMSDDNLARIDRSLANLDTISGEMIALQRRSAAVLDAMPLLIDDARDSLARVDRLTEDLASLTPRAREIADELATLTRTATMLGTRLDERLLPRVDRTLDHVERAAGDVSRTAADVSRTADDVSRAARALESQPESLIHGRDRGPAGPGEAGYQRPPEE